MDHFYSDAVRAWKSRDLPRSFTVDDDDMHPDDRHRIPSHKPLTRDANLAPPAEPAFLKSKEREIQSQKEALSRPIRNIVPHRFQPAPTQPPIATLPLRHDFCDAPVRVGPARWDPMEPQPLRVAPIKHPMVPMYMDTPPPPLPQGEAASRRPASRDYQTNIVAGMASPQPIATPYPLQKPTDAAAILGEYSPHLRRPTSRASARSSVQPLPHDLRTRPVTVDFNWMVGESDDPSVMELLREANIPGPKTAAARSYRPAATPTNQQHPSNPSNPSNRFEVQSPSQLRRKEFVPPEHRAIPTKDIPTSTDIKAKYAHRGWTQVA